MGSDDGKAPNGNKPISEPMMAYFITLRPERNHRFLASDIFKGIFTMIVTI